MSFRDNLQHLRATRNMTQEQLAMLLGVSRQSVSKWEAEKAYPEMDKLTKLCEIFDCTLDDLVTGDLTDRAAEPALAIDPLAGTNDVTGYDEVMLRTAHRFGIGVGVLLLGVGLSGFLAQAPSIAPYLSHDFGPMVALSAGVAAGLLLIIPAAFERGAFQKAHPYVVDFYTSEQRQEAYVRMGRGIAAGVAFIMVGLALSAAFGGRDEGLAALMLFSLMGVGVGLIVDSAMVGTRTKLDDYNDDALAELTDEEIDALDDPDLARRARARKRDGALYGAIMLGATIVGLLWLFCGQMLGLSHEAMAVFWVPWPIGGLICALVGSLRSAK